LCGFGLLLGWGEWGVWGLCALGALGDWGGRMGGMGGGMDESMGGDLSVVSNLLRGYGRCFDSRAAQVYGWCGFGPCCWVGLDSVRN